MTGNIITREQARSNGSAKFYDGKPCWRGHQCERWVADGTCVECAKQNLRDRLSFQKLIKSPEGKGMLKTFVSRDDAIRMGEMYFYDGKKCKHGHIDKKFTKSGDCLACRSGKRRYSCKMCKDKCMLKKVHYKKRKSRIQLCMISDYEIEFLFKMQNDKCAWCGNLIDGDNFHLDHVVPIAFGGTNDPHNIVVSCNTCNHTKSDTCPGQFLESYRIGAPILAKKIVENAIGSHISMIERENLVEMAKQGVYKAKFSREK